MPAGAGRDQLHTQSTSSTLVPPMVAAGRAAIPVNVSSAAGAGWLAVACGPIAPAPAAGLSGRCRARSGPARHRGDRSVPGAVTSRWSIRSRPPSGIATTRGSTAGSERFSGHAVCRRSRADKIWPGPREQIPGLYVGDIRAPAFVLICVVLHTLVMRRQRVLHARLWPGYAAGAVKTAPPRCGGARRF